MVDTSVEGFKSYITAVLSPGTADKYARNLVIFLKAMEERNFQSFSDLPPNLLSQYTVLLRNKGYSPSTAHNHIYTVKRYLDWVESQGEPVTRMTAPDLPRIQFRIREILDLEQLTRYFELANEFDEPVRTAVMVAPCIGLRSSELCALRLEHLRKGRFSLNGETREALLLRVIGKGGKERVVPFLVEGEEILREYLTGWRRSAKGPWLFPAGHNPRLSLKALPQRTLGKALIKLREPMNLTFTAHTMRRTYLTALWRRGVSEAALASIAGHKDISTLIKHYLVLNDQDILERVHRGPEGARLLV